MTYFGGDNTLGVTTGAVLAGTELGNGGGNSSACNVDSDCKLLTLDEGEVSSVTELLVLRVGLSDANIAIVEAWQRGDFLELRTGLERDLRTVLSIS